MSNREFDLRAVDSDRDLALVVDFMCRELPPDQMEAVRRRLDEDPAFLEFAAPIVAAFTLPIATPDVSREFIEREWDRFTKKANFVHQRRRKRRKWMLFGAFLLVTALAIASWTAVHARRTLSHAYLSVPDSGRTVQIAKGISAQVYSGTLAQQPKVVPNVDVVTLDGSATFTVLRAPDSTASPLAPPTLMVQTSAGTVAASTYTVFKVSVHGDTTDVRVVPRSLNELPFEVAQALAARGLQYSGLVLVSPVLGAGGTMLPLKTGQIARVVAGGSPVIIP